MTTQPQRNGQASGQEVDSPDAQQPEIADLPAHRVTRTRAARRHRKLDAKTVTPVPPASTGPDGQHAA